MYKRQLLLAVLEKRLGLKYSTQDVYLSVAGGLRLDEPSADMSSALALISTLRDLPVREDLIAFGEIGLSGECRAVTGKMCIRDSRITASNGRQVAKNLSAVFAFNWPKFCKRLRAFFISRKGADKMYFTNTPADVYKRQCWRRADCIKKYFLQIPHLLG